MYRIRTVESCGNAWRSGKISVTTRVLCIGAGDDVASREGKNRSNCSNQGATETGGGESDCSVLI